MFENIFILKLEAGKFKLTLKNPLGLTCDKVIQTPRIFQTKQIQTALDNIQFIDIEEKILPELIIQSIEYIFKEFFLYMHQTGLYNRQFDLWRAIANITQVTIYELKNRFLKKVDLNAYLVYFFIDPKAPCCCLIVDKNKECDFQRFKSLLYKTLAISNLKKLKGVFYLLNKTMDREFAQELKTITSSDDPISKYESVINHKNNIRLNLISYNQKNEIYDFKHIYPDLSKIEVKLKQ